MKVLRRECASIVKRLLPDTKLPKYPAQLFLVGDLAGDLAEKVEGAADIGGEKIAGGIVVETGADILKCGVDFFQCFVMTRIGNDGSFADFFSLQYTLHQCAF